MKLSVVIAMTMVAASSTRGAVFTETEPNDSKATANAYDLGVATSAVLAGSSASSAEPDYFKLTTHYATPGIYVNQFQLNNATNVIQSIRGLTQTAGTVNAGTDPLFQGSVSSGTPSPYGFTQFYSLGGAGKSQSITGKIAGASTAVGGSYTSTFTSARVTPKSLGTFAQGRITLAAQANVGSSGVATNTSVVVYDGNYDLYVDQVAGSATFGYVATNDNGSSGFNLARSYAPGTYYVAVGIGTLATNHAAASDDALRNGVVLDDANVIATNNTFYDGNNGNTRPADFVLTPQSGAAFSTANEVIPSLYAVNFYTFTVAAPEPASLLLVTLGAGPLALRRRRRR